MKKTKIALLILFGFLLIPGHAFADPATSSIVTQGRKPYQVPPTQIGSFIIDPGIGVSGVYDDNIYSSQNNRKADYITVLRPDLRIKSDFNMHELDFGATGAFGRYKTQSSENFDDYALFANGRLDVIDYATYLTGTLQYDENHEDRSSVDSFGADRPVVYHHAAQGLGFVRALGIIKLALGAVHERLTFNNSTSNGTVLDNSGRDRDVYTSSARLSYEYRPGHDVYISGLNDRRRYLSAGDRDSDGYEAQIGTDAEITGKLTGNLYGGYLNRNYQGQFSDISAVSFGGSLLWNVTGITSVTGALSRGIEETTLADTSGAVTTRASVEIQHALRPNIFLLPSLAIVQDKFESDTVANRTDETHVAAFNIEYLPIPNVSATIGYSHAERDSNAPDGDYTDNRFMLTLSKRF